MNSERKNGDQSQQQDALLQEGRNDEPIRNPFDKAQQDVANDTSLQEESDAEQQAKEAMTERD